ncbi:MAG: hypothetical protein IJS39_07280 [Synergistaceae bacterium]|nr:hypothetical protein [Synergistaceae bacterium]
MNNVPNISVQTSNMLIIASGIGITFNKDADFIININFSNEFSFSVRFVFIDNENNEKPDLHFKSDENAHLITITCINFSDILGTGTTKPTNLATYNGRKIFMNFWVRTTTNKENREIRYCLYMED